MNRVKTKRAAGWTVRFVLWLPVDIMRLRVNSNRGVTSRRASALQQLVLINQFCTFSIFYHNINTTFLRDIDFATIKVIIYCSGIGIHARKHI